MSSGKKCNANRTEAVNDNMFLEEFKTIFFAGCMNAINGNNGLEKQSIVSDASDAFRVGFIIQLNEEYI